MVLVILLVVIRSWSCSDCSDIFLDYMSMYVRFWPCISCRQCLVLYLFEMLRCGLVLGCVCGGIGVDLRLCGCVLVA